MNEGRTRSDSSHASLLLSIIRQGKRHTFLKRGRSYDITCQRQIIVIILHRNIKQTNPFRSNKKFYIKLVKQDWSFVHQNALNFKRSWILGEWTLSTKRYGPQNYHIKFNLKLVLSSCRLLRSKIYDLNNKSMQLTEPGKQYTVF